MHPIARSILRFIYRVIATLLAQVAWVARVMAVLSPNFFLYFRGESAAALAPLAPELNLYRLLLAIVLSLLFAAYFVWDALVVAGRPSRKHPHVTGHDWDRAKAEMEDGDPSMMGTSAWLRQRARQANAKSTTAAGLNGTSNAHGLTGTNGIAES